MTAVQNAAETKPKRIASPALEKAAKSVAKKSEGIGVAKKATSKTTTAKSGTTTVKVEVNTGSNTPRLGLEGRTEQILESAVKVAAKVGLMVMTRDQVAAEAGISAALVTRYFEGMEGLRDAIVSRAVETGNVRILAEALVYKHKGATKHKSKFRDGVIKLLFN